MKRKNIPKSTERELRKLASALPVCYRDVTVYRRFLGEELIKDGITEVEKTVPKTNKLGQLVTKKDKDTGLKVPIMEQKMFPVKKKKFYEVPVANQEQVNHFRMLKKIFKKNGMGETGVAAVLRYCKIVEEVNTPMPIEGINYDLAKI